MKYSVLISIILLSFLSISCSVTSEGRYHDLLEEYSEGKVSNTSLITEAILDSFSTVKAGSGNLYYNKSLVITGSGSDISLLFPEELKLNADKIISDNISYADAGMNRIVLGNSRGFCVFDMDGDPVNLYMADTKEKIDASAIRGDNAVFLTGGTVHELSGEQKKVERIDPGVYNPPYRKLFRAAMISTDRYYGLITGIAGSYYISVFKMDTGTAFVKNIASSSFEFNIKDDYVLYIRGGTGVWTVIRYDIPVKKRNEIKKLGKLSDVYLAEEGFIYISDKKTYIENLSGEKWDAPEDFNVKGTCRNSVLAEHKGVTYIIDFNVLFERLKEYSQAKSIKSS